MILDEYLSQNDCKTLEFKENARSLLGLIKTIIAFANTSGGVLIVGIRDKTREIVGLAKMKISTQKSLTSISYIRL